MERPSTYRYTPTHEWAYVENKNIVVIGITDHLLREHLDLVTLDYPDLEENLVKGNTFTEIQTVESLIDIHAPVNGEVIEMNMELEFSISLLNKDPFGKGWLLKLRVEDPGQVDDLMTVKAYERHIGVAK